MTGLRSESGFSLIELLIATGLLLAISSIVTTAVSQMTASQKTIWNRTEMHSGVRGATELLQQEVGQAGRITLPSTVTLGAAVVRTPAGVYPCVPQDVPVVAADLTKPATTGMFLNEILTMLDGDTQESVVITAFPSTSSITACFSRSHLVGATVVPLGGFATGIIPDTGIAAPMASTDSVLKMYGDINGDSKMVYVEYTCDTTAHNLYRNVIPFADPPPKPLLSNKQILLSNIYPNPGLPATPCFKYQTSTITLNTTPPVTFTFVLDVAITLTVQTQDVDPVTKAYQRETKALLNVSPRNVFNSWALAGIGYADRIQPTPASVTALLPTLP